MRNVSFVVALPCNVTENLQLGQVNDQDVRGATHTRVVNIIKFGGDTVSLKVFNVTPEEAGRLKRVEGVYYFLWNEL